jgi:hypothetical protein
VSPPDPETLEQDLRQDSDQWAEDYLIRLYPDTRKGLQQQLAEEEILDGHGYLLQSSELAREGSLMVAYVREGEEDQYKPLAHPGLGAATDPDSFTGRFARPLAWFVAILVFGFALLLLYLFLG